MLTKNMVLLLLASILLLVRPGFAEVTIEYQGDVTPEASTAVRYRFQLFDQPNFTGDSVRLQTETTTLQPLCFLFSDLDDYNFNNITGSVLYSAFCATPPARKLLSMSSCSTTAKNIFMRLYARLFLRGNSMGLTRQQTPEVLCQSVNGGTECIGFMPGLPRWLDEKASSLRFCINGATADPWPNARRNRTRLARGVTELDPEIQASALATYNAANPTPIVF